MNIPQAGRRPSALTPDQERALLRKRRKLDKSDPFATDPDEDISKLGRLALRRKEIDDLFALGDLCAVQSFADDQRLLVVYVNKALIAYRRAAEVASNSVDRKLAERALSQYIKWVVNISQQYPTRRNLAVALWAATDDDENEGAPSYSHSHALIVVLEAYRQRTLLTGEGASDPTDGEHGTDEDGTQTAFDTPVVFSDPSMTVADLTLGSSVLSQMRSTYAESGETRAQALDSVPSSQSELSQDIDQTMALGIKSSTASEQSEYGIGDYIDDRYEVAEVLWGGMGVVYLCYDHRHREPVAIKSFQGRFLENERAVARFTHEALTWIRLEKHQHIVQARLVQQINGKPHIILEYISGQEQIGPDLRSWINHRRLDITKSLEFGLHIALGMQHATTRVPGLVHRDLKPANILVTHEDIAKVTDFGLVRSLDLESSLIAPGDENYQDSDVDPSDRLTRVGAIVGTAPYMSPEQCLSKDVDVRSDIYSFGCVLYEMLVGERVFKAHKFPEWTQAHINEQPIFTSDSKARIPARLRNLTLACLEKNPHNRPENWGRIVDELTTTYTETTGRKPVLEITGPALEARDLIDKAYSLTALGRYQEALDAYDLAIDLQPEYAWAWARKGRTLRLLERYEAALACYNRALKLQPHYAWAWNGKGIVLQRMNRLSEALECFETATRINPNNVWNWYNRADVLQTLERFQEAIPLLERGLQLDPEHPNSWAKLGQIHRLLQNHEEAVHAYEQAIRLEPTYAWAHNGCGLALRALGKPSDALMAFRRATRYDATEVWHWYNLADVLLELGQYVEATEPARIAVQIDPGHAFSWAKLGQSNRYRGQYDESLTAYNRALEIDPESAFAVNGKGIVLEQLERHEEALICYQKAAQLKPNDVWHWYNQGNVLILMDRFEEARAPLEKAVEVSPAHARSWTRLGNVLRQLGHFTDSLEACRKAIDFAPEFAWAWYEWGMTAEAAEHYTEALEAFQTAAERAPDESLYLYKQIDLVIALDNNTESGRLLEVALSMDDQNPQLWTQHGLVSRRLGHLEQALSSYARALALAPQFHAALDGKGMTLSKLKRHEEALECFQKAVEIQSSDVWYWYHLADEQLALSRIEDALDSLVAGLVLDDKHVESWAKRGQALRRLGRYDDSIKAFDRAVQLNPDYSWAWNGRGLTFKEIGKYEEALVSYEQATNTNPSVVWYAINQVDILLEMQRRADALDVIDKAIEANPLRAVVWARRGQILRRLNRPAEAVESYERSIEIDPGYAWAWNGKGLCLSGLNRWQEAMACYKTAIQHEANDVWFWHNYGESLIQLGMEEEAEEVFEEALALDNHHLPTIQKLQALRKRL